MIIIKKHSIEKKDNVLHEYIFFFIPYLYLIQIRVKIYSRIFIMPRPFNMIDTFVLLVLFWRFEAPLFFLVE